MVCAQVSLLLSGASATFTVQPLLFLDGSEGSTLGEGTSARQIKCLKKMAAWSSGELAQASSLQLLGILILIFWNSVDTRSMIKEGAG